MRKRILGLLLWCVILVLEPCQAYAATLQEIEEQVAMMPEELWPEAPNINSQSAIVVERNTGVILYEKKCTEKRFPASTTKMMTALLVLEECAMDEIVTYSWKAVNSIGAGASHIGIRTGEQLSVKDSLCGLLIPSANEVANGLAEYVSGSMENFAQQMNERAKELGVINTNFENANGLHSENHYTCAYDLYLILNACVDIPTFVEIDSITAYVKKADSILNRNIPMGTTNKLIKKDSPYYNATVVCGKTGSTTEAGKVLATYACKDGMELICITMGATGEHHFQDTNKLLNYCFSNFNMMQLSADSMQEGGGSLLDVTPLHVQREPLLFQESLEQGYAILPNSIEIDALSKEQKVDQQGTKYLEYRLQDYVLGTVKIEAVKEEARNDAFLEKESYQSSLIFVEGKLYSIHVGMIVLVVVIIVALVVKFRWKRKERVFRKIEKPKGTKNRADERVKYSKRLRKKSQELNKKNSK